MLITKIDNVTAYLRSGSPELTVKEFSDMMALVEWRDNNQQLSSAYIPVVCLDFEVKLYIDSQSR